MILIFIVGILLGLIVWNHKALWMAYQRRKKEIQRKKPFQYEYQMGESTIVAIGNRVCLRWNENIYIRGELNGADTMVGRSDPVHDG